MKEKGGDFFCVCVGFGRKIIWRKIGSWCNLLCEVGKGL